MADKLQVEGLGALDGTYDFNLAGMLTVGHPDCLTNREGHRIKQMTGIRAGEFLDAARSGDNDMVVAVASIVLSRARKNFDEAVLWDAPMGSQITIEPDNEPVEGDAVPPGVAPSEPRPIAETG